MWRENPFLREEKVTGQRNLAELKRNLSDKEKCQRTASLTKELGGSEFCGKKNGLGGGLPGRKKLSPGSFWEGERPLLSSLRGGGDSVGLSFAKGKQRFSSEGGKKKRGGQTSVGQGRSLCGEIVKNMVLKRHAIA